MKLSVSIPDEDVRFIDDYAAEHGVDTRSAVLQKAVSLLRSSELGQAYADAWAEWDEGDAALWESTIADGRPSRAR